MRLDGNLCHDVVNVDITGISFEIVKVIGYIDLLLGTTNLFVPIIFD